MSQLRASFPLITAIGLMTAAAMHGQVVVAPSLAWRSTLFAQNTAALPGSDPTPSPGELPTDSAAQRAASDDTLLPAAGPLEPESMQGKLPEETAARFAASDEAPAGSPDAGTSSAVTAEEVAAYGAEFVEPPLPTNDGPQVLPAAEQHPQEYAATPRRFRYRLSLDLRGVYDDNVTLAPRGNRREDFYTAIMPEITAGIGDVDTRQENFVALHYAPSAFIFFDNSDFTTVEQIGRLEAQWRIRRIALALSQSLQSVQSSNLNVANAEGGFSNQINLDIGGRRRINTYTTRVSAAAELSGKTSLRLGVDYSITDPEGLIGSQILAGTVGLDYRFRSKLTMGLALSAGKQFVEDPNPDTTFEQINLRANYEVTGKISATGSAGVEFRHAEHDGRNNASPIFRLGVAYAPFDGTQFDLSATRRTMNSASAFGQDFTSTQVVVSARQRLLRRFFLSFAAGFQNQTYFSTATGVRSDREDNYYFIAPGIDVRITEFWFVGAFYTRRTNDSSLPFYTFDDNQYGIRTSLRF